MDFQEQLERVRTLYQKGRHEQAMQQLEAIVTYVPTFERYSEATQLALTLSEFEVAERLHAQLAGLAETEEDHEVVHRLGQLVKHAPREQPSSHRERVYEMLWDCQFCGTEKLLGVTHRFCPNCGAPQNPDARYYPSDEDKVAVEDHAFVGADRTCPNCNELNSAASKFCEQCGAPMDAAEAASTLQARDQASGQGFASSGSRDLEKEEFEAEMVRAGVTEDKAQEGGLSPLAVAALVGAVVVAVGLIAFALFATEEATLVVIGHEWEREIRVEQYERFTESSWRDSRPSGDEVRLIAGSCEERQRSTRRVDTGREDCRTVQEDRGDGTFVERQECEPIYEDEPVYDDWCRFEGFRWEYERSVTTSGDLNDPPTWGELNLRCADQRREDCEREESRDDDYWVILRGSDENRIEYRCDFPQNEWQSIPIESIWTGQIRMADQNALLCSTLERQ